jgi:predicted RNA-binding protein
MCQATVYLDEQKIMEEVIWLEPTADGFLLRTFFGEPREVKGTMVGIDLLKHRVLLTSTDPPREGSEK